MGQRARYDPPPFVVIDYSRVIDRERLYIWFVIPNVGADGTADDVDDHDDRELPEGLRFVEVRAGHSVVGIGDTILRSELENSSVQNRL